MLLRRDRAVLVLVDFQERLHPHMHGADAVLANAVRLAETARVLGVPVLVTEHAVETFGPTLEPLRRALGPFDPVPKISFSCFGAPGFDERLAAHGRPQVLLAGEETHICVSQTALEAAARGYAVHVAEDACGARRPEHHAAGLGRMRLGGVLPVSAEAAIFELLERAGSDEFRRLLPVIKRG